MVFCCDDVCRSIALRAHSGRDVARDEDANARQVTANRCGFDVPGTIGSKAKIKLVKEQWFSVPKPKLLT